ncbi:MAG: hypothetical protein AB1486_11575 [Planctomycetota bacterium]
MLAWMRAVLVRGVLVFLVALAAGSVAAAQGTIPADEPVWDQVTTRVSVDSTGVPGNDSSYLWTGQSISGDGRYVVFVSGATNLVPGDTNRLGDVFLHDRLTGETSRASVSSDGRQANHSSGGTCISRDGRYVAFGSDATNLVPDDTNRTGDVFVHD